MKNNSRIYAAIHMDALEQNLENMRKNLTPGTKMIGVIKATLTVTDPFRLPA